MPPDDELARLEENMDKLREAMIAKDLVREFSTSWAYDPKNEVYSNLFRLAEEHELVD